jgi:hypothetical protein
MSEDITIYNKQQASNEGLQMLLNQEPSKSEVRTNKMANNSQYLSIATVERLLDENYAGIWNTKNFRWQVVANEIIGSIDLEVFQPAAKMWITRTGAASAMIQLDSWERDENGNILKDEYGRNKKDAKLKVSDVDRKILNTLVKDFPHLKAECLKNAAKSLGVRFGRNLNRGQEEEFSYLSENMQSLSENGVRAAELLPTAKITESRRAEIEKKIRRANADTLKQIVLFLENNQ